MFGSMASADWERKRKQLETAGGREEKEVAAAAAADEEDEEERWVGPLPGEAAQAKKRRGNGGSGGALARRPLLWGAAREASVRPWRCPGPAPKRWDRLRAAGPAGRAGHAVFLLLLLPEEAGREAPLCGARTAGAVPPAAAGSLRRHRCPGPREQEQAAGRALTHGLYASGTSRRSGCRRNVNVSLRAFNRCGSVTDGTARVLTVRM
ncbi:PREDICTED: uncharacterized protein LOC104839959 [Haliaeetus leucocephalus]|uniref:uncharacterized protein LOC104839959 n=1 Tax=Haliaeetus leucocephalus TaxID=52644 RepID=UPI00053CCF42|nr:PREDICTED: uncharacterized protein LOC104839959 [Haliaeetus leucocephalus]